MRGKLCLIMLTALLSVQLSSCTGVAVNNNAPGKVVSPGTDNKKPEISIIIPGNDPTMDSEFSSSYRRRFESEYGVEVNYIAIGDALGEKGKEDYFEKLATMLHKRDGAELILCNWYGMDSLVTQKAVVNVRGKIPNLDKVYESLVSSEAYYIPIGMAYIGIVLNKKVMEELNIAEPDLDWTKQDYYIIRERWLAEAERPLTRIEFYDIIDKYLNSLNIFDRENNKANISTQEMKEFIKSVRDEIYSGKYLLKRDYSYENYYNLLFDEQSKEFQDETTLMISDEYLETSLRNLQCEYMSNLLIAENNDYIIKWNDVMILPRFEKHNPYVANLGTWGFLVNRNGKELELAYEFLNGLLSDEVQMQMLNVSTDTFCYYPVSKAVESDIRSMENRKQLGKGAVELREYALNKVKDGEFSMDFYINEKEREMFTSILKDISKYIFADKKYSDEELSKELQGLEDKYNIWLNE